jgi:hypothetical protein
MNIIETIQKNTRVVKENFRDIANKNSILKYIADNKPDVLLYLPPALHLGTILLHNNIDDSTTKMEGPISSMMHTIEKSFNS